MLARSARITAVLLGASLVWSAAAPAQDPRQPYATYDGRNPFRCQLQDVGTGTDFDRPRADPFCVEFDKTQQNVTGFGLVDFLAKEPARVGAAGPKCFYFQRDHWTGSVVQGQEPELWHWDGNYFFDKALATGGVSVANFRLAGVPMDASAFAPAAFKPFLHPGGGGAIFLRLGTEADPGCAARVDTRSERRATYRRWYRRATRASG